MFLQLFFLHRIYSLVIPSGAGANAMRSRGIYVFRKMVLRLRMTLQPSFLVKERPFMAPKTSRTYNPKSW